jgi:hypothetical protein
LGDRLDGKQGFEVAARQGILQPPQKGKQRGVLKKHHRQRAHQTIVQAVVDFAGLTAVFDVLEELG